jgi:CubicO group peptidase (beta-lactamase class C family)
VVWAIYQTHLSLTHLWRQSILNLQIAITQIEDYLAEKETAGFSGMILIAKGEEVLLRNAYGLANREEQLAPTPETPFCIGSLTKQFTAAAILHLATQDKLQFSDSIAAYFPDTPADKSAITIHHLLTHTAGLEDIFGDDYELVSRDWIVDQALNSSLLWEPGHQYQYSNAGYSLLGAITELVSGQPYERYLHEHLLQPAGLRKTGYVLPKWNAMELAVGYENDARWGTPLDHPWADDGPSWNLRANGGLFSTINDLHQWLLSLKNNQILSPEATAKFFGRHVEIGPDHYYGYGWGIALTPHGTQRIGHLGGNGVFNAVYRCWPADDYLMLIMLTNVDRFAGEKYSPTIEKMLFHQPAN